MNKGIVTGAVLGAMAGVAAAGQIVFTAEFTLAGPTGGPGLHGAVVTFVATFADTATYGAGIFGPTITAASNSFTISGSTGGVDGSYSTVGQTDFIPGLFGQWFSGSGNTAWALPGFQGEPLRGSNWMLPVNGISVGDTIDTSHFSTTLSGQGRFSMVSNTPFPGPDLPPRFSPPTELV